MGITNYTNYTNEKKTKKFEPRGARGEEKENVALQDLKFLAVRNLVLRDISKVIAGGFLG